MRDVFLANRLVVKEIFMEDNIKQKFGDMLTYQEKDKQLRKLLQTIDRDEALVSKNKHKKAFNDAKQALADCETKAKSVLGTYTEAKQYIDSNEQLLQELENSSAATEEELAERVKKLESLKSKFQAADKKVRDASEKSNEVFQARRDAIKTGNAAKQCYSEAKEKHDRLIASKADEITALKSELQRLREKLDPTFFAEYQKLDAENKFPPLVIASGDEKKDMYNCGGCGLGLPQQGNAQLKDKGWCRCDNCRRIIVRLK